MTVELSNASSPFVLTAPHTMDVDHCIMPTVCDRRGFYHDFLFSDQPALREEHCGTPPFPLAPDNHKKRAFQLDNPAWQS